MPLRQPILWLLLLLSAFLGGCAFQNAIDNGNTFVEQREYRRALAEYERALRLDPDSDEATTLIGQIKPYALDEAEADMKAELDVARYERAMKHVAYIRRYDKERASKLDDRVEGQMRTHIEAHMAKGEMLLAYPVAVRAAKIFPKMIGLPDIFARLRGHYFNESDVHLAAARFPEALASLDVIERHEPHMAKTLAPRRVKIRGKWADEVVASAKTAESKDELGVATVLYARAVEIAGRAEDGDSMRRLVRILREDGAFHLAISFDGDKTRSGSIRRLSAPRLSAIDGLVVSKTDEGSMIAKVNVGRASCRESFTKSTRSKDYVAGTQQVPNPAYEQLSTDIDNVSAEIAALNPKVTGQRSLVSTLENRVRRCEGKQQRMRQNGKDRRQLPDCNPVRNELSKAKSDLSSMESTLSSKESSLSSLTSRRSSTPRTLTEDIIETFTYEVRHHRRSCGTAFTARLEPAWSGVENHSLKAASATSDDSHPSHDQYGIGGDPLDYPLSDSDLIAHADQDAAAKVAALMGSKVTSYYRAMTDRAFKTEATDHVAAVDMLVAIVVAGRKHLDAGRSRRIQATLHKHYGLKSIETLRK